MSGASKGAPLFVALTFKQVMPALAAGLLLSPLLISE
jgi:hypothetical protein